MSSKAKRRVRIKRGKDSQQDKRIQKLEKQVRTLTKTSENKIVDYNIPSMPNPQAISTGGLTYLAFARNLQTGSDGDQRIGNKITLMSQTWKGSIRAPFGALDEQQNQVRLLLVENVGYTGLSDLLLTDVLQYGDFTLNGTVVFSSPYRTNATDSTKRYKVHMDKVITLNKTDKGYYHFKKRIAWGSKKSPGKVLTFDSPLDAFPNNHRMVLFCISDSAAANHPDLTWTCRNVYKDS
jgi:hypothetical protein